MHLVKLLGILAFTAVVMPMGGAAAELTNSSLPATTNLSIRTFKVDPNLFYQALEVFPTNANRAANNYSGVGGVHKAEMSGSDEAVSMAMKTFFNSLGVDLTVPGKSIFFNDRLGLLFVRATEPDLETIERAIGLLNMNAPHVHIKARFVEVTKDKSGGSGGYVGWTNPLDVFPGVTASRKSSSQNSDPTNATVRAVLTDADSRIAFHYLELRTDFENFGEPEVTAISGQQTVMLASAVKQDETHFSFPENITIITPQSQTVKFDGNLEIDASVLPDGYTIDLKATASLTNYLSFDETTNATIDDKAGQKINLPAIAPRFYLRQASAHLSLWDGQTVILGNLQNHFYVGGKEVSDKPDADDKEILVFITVEIIDPAGNRIHSDDELPFAQTGVPPQPPQPK